jgi:sulfur carrier protein
VQLIINGATRQVAAAIDLATLVGQVSDRENGIAVALNREVVPRGDWQRTLLADGDRIDVVTAVQGG